MWAHSLTLSRIPGNVNVTPELHSWPAPFHAPLPWSQAQGYGHDKYVNFIMFY